MGFWVFWIVVLYSQFPNSKKRPAKIWDGTGPSGETPTRTTNAFPYGNAEGRGFAFHV